MQYTLNVVYSRISQQELTLESPWELSKTLVLGLNAAEWELMGLGVPHTPRTVKLECAAKIKKHLLITPHILDVPISSSFPSSFEELK